jgi:hypothetical protein
MLELLHEPIFSIKSLIHSDAILFDRVASGTMKRAFAAGIGRDARGHLISRAIFPRQIGSKVLSEVTLCRKIIFTDLPARNLGGGDMMMVRVRYEMGASCQQKVEVVHSALSRVECQSCLSRNRTAACLDLTGLPESDVTLVH